MSDPTRSTREIVEEYRRLLREIIQIALDVPTRRWINEFRYSPLIVPEALRSTIPAYLTTALISISRETEAMRRIAMHSEGRKARDEHDADTTLRMIRDAANELLSMVRETEEPTNRYSRSLGFDGTQDRPAGRGTRDIPGGMASGSRDRLKRDRVDGEYTGSGGFSTTAPSGGLLSPDEPSGGESPTAPPPPAPPSGPPPPERRWINAAIAGHAPKEPLTKGADYLLEFAVDVKKGDGVASSSLPAADLWYAPGEEETTLTVQLNSDDFTIAQPTQLLVVPRRGKSKGKARFDITPLSEGRGVIVATFHKEGNFLQQMEITFSVGADTAELPSVITRGRTLDGIGTLKPRHLSFQISQNARGGYDCVVAGATQLRFDLAMTSSALTDAVDAVRKALMRVIESQGGSGNAFVFQTAIDIPDTARDAALGALSRAGGLLFRRLFYGPGNGLSSRIAGDTLRKLAAKGQQLDIQIVAERFPVPWGLLYLGEFGDDDPRDWNNFLGMRATIEQTPIQDGRNVMDTVIASDQPSLAMSVNVNAGIDVEMGNDFVKRQREYFQRVKETHNIAIDVREHRKDLLDALCGSAAEHVMYLYCHAVTAQLTDREGIYGSHLVLTGRECLTLADLNANASTDSQLNGNPIVFLNACESAELSPMFYDGFVPYFMAKGARGVVGTECKTPALFAAEWALRFFPRFLAGGALGQIFLDLRREFLDKHGNPLGLVYAAYCSSDTQISPSLQ